MLSDVEPRRSRRLGLCEEATGIDLVKHETRRATPSTAMLKTRLLRRPLDLLPSFPRCRAKSPTAASPQTGRSDFEELLSIQDTGSDSGNYNPGAIDDTITAKLDHIGVDEAEEVRSRCLPPRPCTPSQQQPLSGSYLSRYKTSVSNYRPSTSVDFTSTSGLCIRDPFHRPPSLLIKSTRTPLTKVILNSKGVLSGTVNGPSVDDSFPLHRTDNRLHGENGVQTATTQSYPHMDAPGHKDSFEIEVADSIQRSETPRLDYRPGPGRPHSVAGRMRSSSIRKTPHNQDETDQLEAQTVTRTAPRRFVIARNRDVRETNRKQTQQESRNQAAKQSNSYEAYRIRFRASQQALQPHHGEVLEAKSQACHQLQNPGNQQSSEYEGQHPRIPDSQQSINQSSTLAAREIINHEDHNVASNPHKLIFPDASNSSARPQTPNGRPHVIGGMRRPPTPTSMTPSQMKLRRAFPADEMMLQAATVSAKKAIRIPYCHTTSDCSDNTGQGGPRHTISKNCGGSWRTADTRCASSEIHSPFRNREHLESPDSDNGIGYGSPLSVRRECQTPPMNMDSESSLSSIDAEIIPQKLDYQRNRNDTGSTLYRPKEGSNEENNDKPPMDMDDRILSWLWDCEQTTDCTSLPAHLPNIGAS